MPREAPLAADTAMLTDDGRRTFDEVFPATAESLADIRRLLRIILTAQPPDRRLMTDIELAVTEACANVVVHAYPEGGGALEVSATLDEMGAITVVVRDRGRGPGPWTSDGLGLGVPLITALSDSCRLRNRHPGTEVTMAFSWNGARHSAPDEPPGR